MAGHIIVAGGTALTAAEIVALTAGVGLGASAVADATGAYPIEQQMADVGQLADDAAYMAALAANTVGREAAQGLEVLATGGFGIPMPRILTPRDIWDLSGGAKGLVEGVVVGALNAGLKALRNGAAPSTASNRGVPEPIEVLPEQIKE